MSEGGGAFEGAPVDPTGFIIDAIDQGMSATAALGEYRAAGGGFRTDRWYQAWGEVDAALAAKPELASIDYGALPGDHQYVEWSAGRPGTYATQVDLLVHDLDANVTYRHSYTAISDRPMTPQEAVDEAMDVWGGGTTAQGGDYHEAILGGFVSGLYVQTGQ